MTGRLSKYVTLRELALKNHLKRALLMTSLLTLSLPGSIIATTTLTCPPVSSIKRICNIKDANNIPYPACLALMIGDKISFEKDYQWKIMSMRPASFNQPIKFYAATIYEKGVGCIYSNQHRHYFYLGLRTSAHVKPLKSNIQNYWHDNTDSKHHADSSTSEAALTGENRYFCIGNGNPEHCPMDYTQRPQKPDPILVQTKK